MARPAPLRSIPALLSIAGIAPLALALSGCVAAAIPLAAGGLIANRMSGSKAEAGPAPVPSAAAANDIRIARTALTELPPPDAVASTGSPVVGAFRTYALAQLADASPPGRRASALLSRASDLRAERAFCATPSSAVFIDLDPGRGTFDPLAPGTPDPALAAALDELRARGVAVVWFSRLGAGFEAAARAALADAGFDPAGTDRLVLLSDLEERKQSRRDEIARQLCPIALLGDERADFDELYLYLKQADAAVALDAMIGRGWFLVSPFANLHSTRKDITP